MTWWGEKRLATGLTLRNATRAASAHAAAAMGVLGRAAESARPPAAASRRGRIRLQKESSKQASAGTIVSQFRKDRLPLRMRTPWKRTTTTPATCRAFLGP